MKVVDTRREHADIVVVRDLKDMMMATKWKVFLTGGRVAQLEYIVTAGAKGTCLEYKSAVSKQLLEILQDSIAHPTSVWAWFVGNNVEFVTRAAFQKHCWPGHSCKIQ